jgi:hypothetical protein
LEFRHSDPSDSNANAIALSIALPPSAEPRPPCSRGARIAIGVVRRSARPWRAPDLSAPSTARRSNLNSSLNVAARCRRGCGNPVHRGGARRRGRWIIINSLSQPRGADQAAYAHTVKAPAPSLSLGGGSDPSSITEETRCHRRSTRRSHDHQGDTPSRRHLQSLGSYHH